MKKKLLLVLAVIIALSLGAMACTAKEEPIEQPPALVYYSVTLDAVDGTFENGESTKVVKVLKDAKLTIAEEPTNGDFVLEDWYADSDYYNMYSMTSAVTKDITIYVYWATAAASFDVESNGDGDASLIAFKGEVSNVDLRIPNYYMNNVGSREKITNIGDEFMNKDTHTNALTNLILPKTLKFIGTYAFYQQGGLTEVEITCDVGANAFRACDKLETVTFKGDNIVVNDGAFYQDVALVDIDLTGVIEVKAWSLSSCGFTELDFTGVEIIAAHSTRDNLELVSVIFGGTSTIIGDAAFQGCSKLVNFTSNGTISEIKDWAFTSCPFVEIDLLGVEKLGANVFYDCNSLVTVKIGDDLQSIGNASFRGTSIVTIDLTGVAIVGDYVFYDVATLTSITLGGTVTAIGEGTFRGTSIASIDLTGVTTVGNGLFYGQTNLTTVILDGTNVTIGKGAFNNCSNLTSVDMNGAVTSIGEDALRGTSITTIDLTGVVSIGKAAFASTKLVTFVIPATVTTLGGELFYDIATLTLIDVSATTATSSTSLPEGWAANWAAYYTGTITYAAAL